MMISSLLEQGKKLLVVLLLALQGCSSLQESSYVPTSPETLNEWMVEGRFVLRAEGVKSKSYFYFKQLGENYQLAVLMDDPVGAPKAVISGNVYAPQEETLDVMGGVEAKKVAEHLHAQLQAGDLSYWVRGLPATANAVIYQENMYVPDSIEEKGWNIAYQDYMSVQGGYRLPADMEMKSEGASPKAARSPRPASCTVLPAT